MFKKLKHNIPAVRLNLTALCIFSILLGIYFTAMPKYADDYWFSINLAEWHKSQNVSDITEGGNIFIYGIPFKDIVETWHYHWLNDNVRLCNILVVFFLLFPKWVGSGVMWLAWLYSMFISYKIAGIKKFGSPIVGLSIVLWGLFLPWSSHLGALDYQFNYIGSTAVSLWFLSKMLKQGSSGFSCHGRFDFLKCCGFFLLGLLAGWWHEAFSCSLWGIVIVLIIFYKYYRNLPFVCGIAGLTLGIIILSAAPGTHLRLHGNPMYLTHKIVNVIAYNLPYYAFLFFSFVYAIKHGFQKLFYDRVLMSCIIGGLIPVLMSIVLFAAARVTWFTQILAIVGLMRLFDIAGWEYWIKYKISNAIWIVPLVLLVLVRFIVADIYAFKTRKMMRDAIEKYITNPDKTVFSKVITIHDIPLIAIKLPDVMINDEFVYMTAFFSNRAANHSFNIIPEELRNATSQSGKRIDGDVGLRSLSGKLFISGDSINYQNNGYIDLKMNWGDRDWSVRCYTFKFISEADGKEYAYVNFLNPWFEPHYKCLKSANYPERGNQ